MSLRVLFPGCSHAALTTPTEHASNHNNLYSMHSAPTGPAFLIIKENIEHPRLRHLYLVYYTRNWSKASPRNSAYLRRIIEARPPSKVGICLKITFQAIKNVEVKGQSIWLLFYFRRDPEVPSHLLNEGHLSRNIRRIQLKEKQAFTPPPPPHPVCVPVVWPLGQMTDHGGSVVLWWH